MREFSAIPYFDIVYYGADLAHYLLNEFVDHDYALHTHAIAILRQNGVAGLSGQESMAEDW
jgi:hypothetical protein